MCYIKEIKWFVSAYVDLHIMGVECSDLMISAEYLPASGVRKQADFEKQTSTPPARTMDQKGRPVEPLLCVPQRLTLVRSYRD